jgi:phosphoribosylformylglycinamidine (FGAM) synthase-like amidotransferase family enzyme
VAFKYQVNQVQTEKIKVDPENTCIAGIISENGNILCSIPDPTIFNTNNEKGNDPKLFFENVVKTLS